MKLFDANEFLTEVVKLQALSPEHAVAKIILLLSDMNGVDAVPVVRCRECKHGVFDEGKGIWKCVESAEWDESIGEWMGFVTYRTHDFYCADGERKDND